MEKIYRYTLVILYYGLICYLSSRTHFDDRLQFLTHFDKLNHFIEYFIFGCLLGFAFFADKLPRVSSKKWLLMVSMLMLLAWLDEFHQRFVPGRHYDYRDLAVDIVAGSLGLLLCRIRRMTRN